MIRRKMKDSDLFAGRFVYHDGRRSSIPKGYYRIELIYHDEQHDLGSNTSYMLDLSNSEGVRYQFPMNSFTKGPWKEVRDQEMIGLLALQWA